MKKQRTRTESLTIRLTAEEKSLIKAGAAKRKLSVTDYLLLSALPAQTAKTEQVKIILKTLTDVQKAVCKNEKNGCPEWEEILDRQKMIYQLLFRLARGAKKALYILHKRCKAPRPHRRSKISRRKGRRCTPPRTTPSGSAGRGFSAESKGL